jgi:hypothetical protein
MNSKTSLIALSLLLGALGAASATQARIYHHSYGKGGQAYGYVNEGGIRGSAGGEFLNGNFIPRGTSPAQVPSHHEEDYYGSEAGKD